MRQEVYGREAIGLGVLKVWCSGRTEPPWYSWRVGLLVSNRLLIGL